MKNWGKMRKTYRKVNEEHSDLKISKVNCLCFIPAGDHCFVSWARQCITLPRCTINGYCQIKCLEWGGGGED